MHIMNLVEKLRQRLSQTNSTTFQAPLPELSEEMAQTTRKLRVELGDITRGGGNEHGIAVSVIAYLKTGYFLGFREMKYVCFGISSEYGMPRTRIIEHESLFLKLLAQVEAIAQEPRKFRRCYQGLLKGYLRYPGPQTTNLTGRNNWLALRDFLANHCTSLKNHKPPVEWAQALYEHRNLLADQPCEPYGKALLAGDTSAVDELKNRLGIDDDTWVMNELILAQVLAATTLKDHEFVPHVTRLVQLLEGHPLLITKGLAALIMRYAKCQEHPEHWLLREVALREWKSPWLEANKALWHAHIGEPATDMMSLWMKKRSIQDFFELLQADGQADRQRMEFWLQYAEAMDEIWLALGQHSLYNNQRDYVRIRRQMEGRYMALEGGSYNQDNAFMVKIGGYVFIEFGKQNNACHVFDAHNLPFKRGQRSVSGTQQGLKNTDHAGHRAKLMHREGWQYEFRDFLRSHTAAMPQTKAAVKIPTPVLTSQNGGGYASKTEIPSVKPKTPTASSPSSEVFDMQKLRAFCATHGMQIEDHRSKGGALWVRGQGYGKIVEVALSRVGFRYKEGKGWWLASPD